MTCFDMCLHEVALEEVVEFPLCGRIGQVADVKATALSNDGEDSLGLVGSNSGVLRTLVGVGDGVGSGSVGRSVGGLSSRHFRLVIE